MAGLELSAKVDGRNPTHAWVHVWQNGGKAGELCVDAEYAERIATLINGAVGLLKACERLHKRCHGGCACKTHKDGEPCSGCLLDDAIAKATPSSTTDVTAPVEPQTGGS